MKKILACMRKAVSDYNMIEDGDKIAVGVSGGKDSLAMLVALNKLKEFLPQKFEIIAVCLTLGFEGEDVTSLEELCREKGIQFIKTETLIGKIIFEARKEKNPCSLCAKMRRGALHNTALENGCNKVALGHHSDDAVETFFLSLFFEGRINTFAPVTYLSRKNLHLIRPLIYAKEGDIKGFIKRNNLNIIESLCPANCKTSREWVKDTIKNICKKDRLIKSRVFGAIRRNSEEWDIQQLKIDN